MNNKNLFIIIAVVGILIVMGWLANNFFGGQRIDKQFVDPTSIGSFEECAAAGYPVMESYPAQCRVTETDKTFTEVINNAPAERSDPATGNVNVPTSPTTPAPPERLMKITSFKECAAAGYPVAQSYPMQCHTPDGFSFTEEIKP